MKKWVFFDLDGTLTDPMLGITSAVKYALSKFGIDVPYLKDLIPFIGPPLKDSFMEYYDFSEDEAEEAIRYYREYFVPVGMFENEVYPGVRDMLAHLDQAGFDLALTSSKPTEFVDKILRHFGLREYFVIVIGSELDGRRSSKAEVISYALRRAQIRGDQAIMVGDRKYDIAGAKECSVESIGVTYGYGSCDELKESGADHMVDTVGELEKEIFAILEAGRVQKENYRLSSFHRRPEIMEAEAFGGNVKFAIAGTGDKAEKFYQANRYGKQFELVAVCGKTMEETLNFAARKGRVVCFDNVEDLAACQSVEAVYIAADIRERCQIALTMLRAGKHVLVETPMAASGKEAREMFSVAKENNVILMEATPSIYAPAFDKMLPYLESLGRVCHATLQNCSCSCGYDLWNRGIVTEEFDPDYGFAALMSQGVYPLSVMVRLFGQPKSVHSAGVKIANGMDVSGSILMEYENMTGEVIYSMISDSAMPSQIQGNQGSMLIREITNIKDLRISRRKVDQSVHFEQSDNIMNHETSAFIRMIRTGMGMDKAEEISLAVMDVLDQVRAQRDIR